MGFGHLNMGFSLGPLSTYQNKLERKLEGKNEKEKKLGETHFLSLFWIREKIQPKKKTFQ